MKNRKPRFLSVTSWLRPARASRAAPPRHLCVPPWTWPARLVCLPVPSLAYRVACYLPRPLASPQPPCPFFVSLTRSSISSPLVASVSITSRRVSRVVSRRDVSRHGDDTRRQCACTCVWDVLHKTIPSTPRNIRCINNLLLCGN